MSRALNTMKASRNQINPAGIFTTEFYVTIAVIASATAGLLTGTVDQDTWKVVVTGASAGYAIGRGLAKG